MMASLISLYQTQFHREFLMGRGNFAPADFGISVDKEEFTDQMVDAFGAAYRGQWTIDELMLHPREAAHFCDDVRRQYGYFDVPDDIVLRVILTRRKNPAG
jgi:hypothetical protein